MNKFMIENARLVDGRIVSIFVQNGVIQQVASSIKVDNETQVIHLDNESYVSAGWIDTHTHCFDKFELYADNCESIGYKKGVTTVIDAGTSGADNVDEFYDSVKNCKTHVYSLLNISKTGLYAQNELADMRHVDSDAFMQAYQKHPHFIIGVKARMSKSVVEESGDLPLFEALKIAEQTKLPLMVHIGTAPSKLETVLANIRSGDIVTHIFNPKRNGIIQDSHIKECVFDAYQRGVFFDLGHGTDSFSFDVLDKANQNDLKVHSISSDIYYRNRQNGPVYDLATTMSKLYRKGYDLKEVIACVTSHPAKMLNLSHLGRIEKGYCGEFTIFKIIHKNKELVDSTGKRIIVSEYIQPVAVIIRNEYIQLEEDC